MSYDYRGVRPPSYFGFGLTPATPFSPYPADTRNPQRPLAQQSLPQQGAPAPTPMTVIGTARIATSSPLARAPITGRTPVTTMPQVPGLPAPSVGPASGPGSVRTYGTTLPTVAPVQAPTTVAPTGVRTVLPQVTIPTPSVGAPSIGGGGRQLPTKPEAYTPDRRDSVAREVVTGPTAVEQSSTAGAEALKAELNRQRQVTYVDPLPGAVNKPDPAAQPVDATPQTRPQLTPEEQAMITAAGQAGGAGAGGASSAWVDPYYSSQPTSQCSPLATQLLDLLKQVPQRGAVIAAWYPRWAPKLGGSGQLICTMSESDLAQAIQELQAAQDAAAPAAGNAGVAIGIGIAAGLLLLLTRK